MTAHILLAYAKVCYECRADFETWDSSDELCPKCQRDWLRENCPEALAEYDAEPVVLPDADDWLESHASRDYLPESEQ